MRIVVGLVVALAMVVPAAALELVVLDDDGALVVFDPFEESTARRVEPRGVSGRLVGIDRRPADGRLYGLAGGSDLYTIDPASGAATLVSTLTFPFDGGIRSGFDFTPQLDRLRLVSVDGRNLRVNVAIGAAAVDGALGFAAADPHAGKRPRVTAAAYANNRPGVATTTLFELESDLDLLVVQDPANDGVLRTVGPLGVDVPDVAGFDIVTDERGGDQAYAAWGAELHRIDLVSGRAARVGVIPLVHGRVVSLACSR